MEREMALEDARKRYNKIKGKVTIFIESHNGHSKIGSKYSDLDITMNEFGRLCELSYIVTRFNITLAELNQ